MMAIIKKKQIITNVGKNVEKLVLLYIADGSVNDAAALENSLADPPKIHVVTI